MVLNTTALIYIFLKKQLFHWFQVLFYVKI